MTFIFDFQLYDNLSVHPCYCKWFYGWVILHYVYVPHLYPFFCSWTFRLLPCLGCCVIIRVHVFVWILVLSEYMAKSGIVGSYCSVISDSLRPHGLQHARLLKLMCIESVMPPNHLVLCRLLLLPSVFPASGSFPVSWPLASSDQRSGVSAPASVPPMNIQDWVPLELTGSISLQSKEL